MRYRSRVLAILIVSFTSLAAVTPLPAEGESSTARGAQTFGTLMRVGPRGHGTVSVVLESVNRSVADDGAVQIDVAESRDRWIEASDHFRPGATREYRIVQSGAADGADAASPRSSYRLRETRRTVIVEVDGTSITHRHEGVVGAGPSRQMPSEMEDPFVLESTFVTDYQRWFDRIRSRAPMTVGAEFSVSAVVPARLAVYRFDLIVSGPDRLRVASGEQEFTKLEVIRREPIARGVSGASSLDERRYFWLADDGEIVRMEIPEQPRFQGSSTTWNHRYRPDYYGAVSATPVINGQAVTMSSPRPHGAGEAASEDPRRPGLLVVHDNSSEGRALVAPTIWAFTRRGWTVGTVGIDPATPADLGRAAALAAGLKSAAGVDPNQLFLLTVGRALPVGAPWDVSTFRGWAMVNATAPEGGAAIETVTASKVPVLVLWGDEGKGLHARREFAESIRPIDAARIRTIPLGQVDGRMRYVPGVPDATPKDDFGLAFGYRRALERWFAKNLDQ